MREASALGLSALRVKPQVPLYLSLSEMADQKSLYQRFIVFVLAHHGILIQFPDKFTLDAVPWLRGS
jgi:hypothetical protein